MKKSIYQIIEQGKHGDKISVAYDVLMFVAIIVSIVPLMFVEDHVAFHYIEMVTVSFFIIDYVLRWITADLRLGKGALSFLIYPFTFWGVIDLLSILPGLMYPSLKIGQF